MSASLLVAAAEDFVVEHYEARLAWADKNDAATVRREFEQFAAGNSVKRAEAVPELDLMDREACGAAAWLHYAAVLAQYQALLRGAEPEPTDLDNDTLVLQMQAAVAQGW